MSEFFPAESEGQEKPSRQRDSLLNWVAALTLVPLAVLLVLVAILSLQWRMGRDFPVGLYLSYLMDHFGYIPYRDFFDVNLPGTYWLYLVVGHLSAYSDFGYRIADLAYLGCVLFVSWLGMKGLGRKVASFGTLLFALAYLRGGTLLSMEREYLILLPLSGVILVSFSFPRLDDRVRGLIAGVLFGLCATIKPAALVGYPVVMLFQWLDFKRRNHIASVISSRGILILLSSLLGLALPLVVVVLYLWRVDALRDFLGIISNYYPLYSEISGDHVRLVGLDRLKYMYNAYFTFGQDTIWFMPAVLGVYISIFHSRLADAQKNQVLLLVGLAFAYSIYALLSFQFHPYHWLPFLYFLLFLSSTCFVEQSGAIHRMAQLVPVGAFLLAIFLGIRPPPEFYAQIAGQPLAPPIGGRVDEIASYLNSHMIAGDKVQPLDWTGGAVQGMLIAGAQVATSFIYDYQFYQNTSSAYILNLRRQFIDELDSSNPRFIIQVETNKPWVTGPGTTTDFPELQRILGSNYRVGLQGDGYVIWERSE